jgi:uncharacterized protein (TIGR03067 family)
MRVRLFVVLGALLLVAADKPADAAKKDLDALQGTWEMAALEVNGQPVPEEKIRGTTLTIKGDKYTVKVKDKSHQTTFKLDPSQKPKAIDMFFPDGPELPKLSKGVYEIDGDTFRLCRHQMPGKDRPAQLGSWPDTGLFVVTWKRLPK